MIHELRLAFRSLAKTPGFTLVAIITIALAIAANTAVFSLVNALLIRPLPFKDPQYLILLFEKFAGQGLDQIPVSAPEYLDWEKQTRSYERIAAFNFADFNLTGGDMPERIQGAVVTPSLFPLLGVPPIQGRVFNDNEFGEGNDSVVVISERLWRRRFNSDPQLVGTQVSVNGRSYPIHATVSQALESEGIKGEAGKIGAGAGVGAIIGGILGGAKGALIGILVGGGGTIAATEGKDVDLPTGTVLRVRLDEPLQLAGK